MGNLWSGGGFQPSPVSVKTYVQNDMEQLGDLKNRSPENFWKENLVKLTTPKNPTWKS